MDFFSLRQPNSSEDHQNTRDFASAIQDRFGSNALLTTRLTPVQEPVHPVRNVAVHPTTVTPSTLNDWLNSPTILILDIRPHAAYSHARIPNALSLSVPSTLLKRPLFSLQRLAAMLASPSARDKFLSFNSYARILVYDADAIQIPENSNIYGLLKKFANDGYEGELAWLKGGFQSVWRERRDLVDQIPPPREWAEDDEDEHAAGRIEASVPGGLPGEDNQHQPHHRPHLGHLPISGPPPPNPAALFLRPSQLASEAFSYHSTTAKSKRKGSINVSPTITTVTSVPGGGRPAFNPFFDTIRQNVELSHGITERIPLRLPKRVRRRIDDLPFDWLKEIAKRADVLVPPSAVTPMPRVGGGNSAQRTPSAKTPSLVTQPKHIPFDSSPASLSSSSLSTSGETPSPPDPRLVEEGMEALAMQFYRIELAEQRRLMGVMEHHSKESSTFFAQRQGREMQRRGDNQNADVEGNESDGSLAFPFSITAGVEKGTKNRYRHIWPFEHARVRLHSTEEDPGKDGAEEGSPARKDDNGDTDDYVNASYVQPLGTNKRYIATQGPLEATFDDFWRLCWEQNVHVIVMLTKEVEGSMVKCGAYWADVGSASSPPLPDPVRQFGPLTLTLVGKEGITAGMSVGRGKGIDLMYQNKEGLKKLSALTGDALGSGGGGFEFPNMMPDATSKSRYRSGRSHKKGRERDRSSRKRNVAGLDSSSATETSTDATSDSLNESESEDDIDVGRITTIKRTFHLTNKQYPEAGARTIIQFQYLEWPDMNVPDDPRGLLDLLERVDKAVQQTGGSGELDPQDNFGGRNIEEHANPFNDTRKESHKSSSGDESGSYSTGYSQYTPAELHAKGKRWLGGLRWEKKEMMMDTKTGIARHALGSKYARPVLLHCSAGVGRTGGYIALDAVLDGIKREMRKRRESTSKSGSSVTAKQDNFITSENTRIHPSGAESSLLEASKRRSGMADMDVDVGSIKCALDAESGPTVPITMSGAQHDVIHVPTVVVSQSREGSAISEDRSGSEERSGSADRSAGNMSDDEASGGNSADGSAEVSASAESGSPPMLEDAPATQKATVTHQQQQLEGNTSLAHDVVRKRRTSSDADQMDVDRDEDSPSGGSSATGTSGEASGGSGSLQGSGGSSRDGGLSSSIASAGSVGAGSGESGNSVAVEVPTSVKHGHHHQPGDGRPLSILTRKWAQNVHDSQLDSGAGNISALDLPSSMIVDPLPGTSSSSASLPSISESELSSASGHVTSSSIGRVTKPHYRHHPGHPSHGLRSSSPARVSATVANAQLAQHLRDQQRQKKKMDQARQKGGHHESHVHGHSTSTGAENTNTSALSLSSELAFSLSDSSLRSLSDSEDDVMMGRPASSVPTTVSEGGSSDVGKGRVNVEGERMVQGEATKLAGEYAALRQGRLFSPPSSERLRTSSAPEMPRGPPNAIPVARTSMANRAKAAMGLSPAQAFALRMPALNINHPPGHGNTGLATDPYPLFMKQFGQQLSTAPTQSNITAKVNVFNLPTESTTSRSDVTSTNTTTADHKIAQPQPVRAPSGILGSKASDPTESQSRSDDLSSNSQSRHTKVDYKEPRALHVADGSPVSLNRFEAPVWEVIQDMREQRMSLCQSLRQYVFVHAAIIEGVLRLVDEEREKGAAGIATKEKGAKEERVESWSAGALFQGAAPAELNPQQIEMSERERRGYMGMDIDNTNTATHSTRSGHFPHLRQGSTTTSPPNSHHDTASVGSSMSSPSKHGKRGASPTELLKEGKKGEVILSKRPSIKRKTQSPPETQQRLDTVAQSPAVTQA